jgi:hypothetical protein
MEINMATDLMITLNEKVLAGSLNQAIEQDIDLNTYIENALNNTLLKPIEPKKPLALNSLINQAIQNSEKKTSGAEFHINDVCSDEMWEQLSSGERKRLGKLFRQEIESRKIAEFLRRTSANKAIYKRL